MVHVIGLVNVINLFFSKMITLCDFHSISVKIIEMLKEFFFNLEKK